MRNSASRHVVKCALENIGNDKWSQSQNAVPRRMCWVCRSIVGSWGLRAHTHSPVHKESFARMWAFLCMVSLTIVAFLSIGDV